MKKPRVRTIDEIVALVSLSYGSKSKEVELVRKAYEYANSRFVEINKRRNSGEPYMNHCLRVAWALANTGKCAETVAAGLLHDTPEDIEGCTIEDIKDEFGEEVAIKVDAVTKEQPPEIRGKYCLTKEECSNIKKKAKESTFTKLIIASMYDRDILAIKIEDRLDNMRDLDFKKDNHIDCDNEEERKRIDREKRCEIATDTLETYAQLADFCGYGRGKIELEDLALLQLDRKTFKRLKRKMDRVRAKRDPEIMDIFKRLHKIVREENMVAEMVDKMRHVYVAYQNELKNIPPEKMDDLITVKVMVGNESDCYKLAKLIRENFIEIEELGKDTIASPKMNGYQSIHITVYGKNGHPFQIQIKTFEMDRKASFGDNNQNMEQLRKLAELNRDNPNVSKASSEVRELLLRPEVILRTMNNEPIILERGSTPVDFAAGIHTGLLFATASCKVNGEDSELDRELIDGDKVEIITRGQIAIRDGLPLEPMVLNQKKSATFADLEKLRRSAGTAKVKCLVSSEITKRTK